MTARDWMACAVTAAANGAGFRPRADVVNAQGARAGAPSPTVAVAPPLVRRVGDHDALTGRFGPTAAAGLRVHDQPIGVGRSV